MCSILLLRDSEVKRLSEIFKSTRWKSRWYAASLLHGHWLSQHPWKPLMGPFGPERWKNQAQGLDRAFQVVWIYGDFESNKLAFVLIRLCQNNGILHIVVAEHISNHDGMVPARDIIIKSSRGWNGQLCLWAGLPQCSRFNNVGLQNVVRTPLVMGRVKFIGFQIRGNLVLKDNVEKPRSALLSTYDCLEESCCKPSTAVL